METRTNILPDLLRRLEIIQKSSKESLASKGLEDIIRNFFYKGNKTHDGETDRRIK